MVFILNISKRKFNSIVKDCYSVVKSKYCNLGKKEIEFFYDTTSFKINKYLPGTKIKIRRYKKLNNEYKYVYLGAWNFKKEIFNKEKSFRKMGGKFITHVPRPRII